MTARISGSMCGPGRAWRRSRGWPPGLRRQAPVQAPTETSFWVSALSVVRLAWLAPPSPPSSGRPSSRLGFEEGPAAGGKVLVLGASPGVGVFLADPACVGQDSTLVEGQEIVQLALPIPEEDLLPAPGLVLGVVEPHHHDPVELGDLCLAQVVLGDRDVRLADGGAFPGGQAHVGLGVVGRGPR